MIDVRVLVFALTKSAQDFLQMRVQDFDAFRGWLNLTVNLLTTVRVAVQYCETISPLSCGCKCDVLASHINLFYHKCMYYL